MKLTVESTDRYLPVTLASAGLLAVAVAMAAVGLPNVDLHGPLHWIGIMDPFCGGTRAARYTALGQWGLAWKYNPLGIATVVAVALVSVRAVVGLSTRRWVTPQIAWTRRGRQIAIAAGVAFLVWLEIRQQGRAELLMANTWTLVDKPFSLRTCI